MLIKKRNNYINGLSKNNSFILLVFLFASVFVFSYYFFNTKYAMAETANWGYNDSDTVLLINSEESSTSGTPGSDGWTFIDSSFGGGRTLTGKGGVTQSDTKYMFGNGKSMYFDGTGDYFTMPTSDDFRFASTDFTMDVWVYITNDTAWKRIFFLGGIVQNWNTTNGIESTLGIYNGDLYYQFNKTGGEGYGSLSVLGAEFLNSWNHVAVTKKDNTTRLFLNGVLVDSTTDVPVSVTTVVADTYIGFDNLSSPSTVEFEGYMDEFRISKGVAQWIADFSDDLPNAPYDLTPPFATSVTATGTPQIGEVFVGDYVYNHDEGFSQGVSTFQWYSSILPSPFGQIAGATGTSTVMTVNENGRYVYFEVTPVDENGNAGAAVISNVIGPIIGTAPSVENVNINGLPKVGNASTGEYDFIDNEEDNDVSTYQWYICNTEDGVYSPISGATSINYTPIEDDYEKFLKFEVTPVADYLPTTGAVATSSYKRVLNMAAPQTPDGENSQGLIRSYIGIVKNIIHVVAGKIGFGVSNPEVELEVDGAIKAVNGLTIGNTTSTTTGTIRWSGTSFEGYNGTEWINLIKSVPIVPTISSISTTTGTTAGGTQTTILGTDFYKTAVVQFDGNDAATTTVVNSTEIITYTPEGIATGTVDVVVINEDWNSATEVNGFTYE